MESDRIAELKAHSVRVGSNPDLVQASGGNTSWKSDKTVWVKGSGKRLKDAVSEDIFSSINYSALTQDEVLACEDFSNLISYDISPSIEAENRRATDREADLPRPRLLLLLDDGVRCSTPKE